MKENSEITTRAIKEIQVDEIEETSLIQIFFKIPVRECNFLEFFLNANIIKHF